MLIPWTLYTRWQVAVILIHMPTKLSIELWLQLWTYAQGFESVQTQGKVLYTNQVALSTLIIEEMIKYLMKLKHSAFNLRHKMHSIFHFSYAI